MRYLTVKEMSESWGVSGSMIRKYCSQNRIPGAKKGETGWLIPDTSEKPEAECSSPFTKSSLPVLARKIRNQKNGRNYHGL